MVGSGASSDRSKEAVGMIALHEALRNACFNSEWTYSVFWTIRPRLRTRGGNGCKLGDENGSLMLMWEDGFCRESVEEINGEDPVRKAFSKMSIQLYNYGEGLMGKVASDKCHKWVFKEPSECEPNISNYWQSSFDAVPSEWSDQFASGIQTIAVIQAGHGLLQLGSCKIIPEDLHFVLRMRHTFESLGYQSGFHLSHMFSSTRNPSSSSSSTATLPASPMLNWSQRPLIPTASAAESVPITYPINDETNLFLPPHSSDSQFKDVITDHDSGIKWQNSMPFTELIGGSEDAKDYLGLESQQKNGRKIDNKFMRSFTLPARVASSSSNVDKVPEAGTYSDFLGTFLD